MRRTTMSFNQQNISSLFLCSQDPQQLTATSARVNLFYLTNQTYTNIYLGYAK